MYIVYYGYAWYYLSEVRGGIGSDVCELPYRSWESNLGPLEKNKERNRVLSIAHFRPEE